MPNIVKMSYLVVNQANTSSIQLFIPELRFYVYLRATTFNYLLSLCRLTKNKHKNSPRYNPSF